MATLFTKIIKGEIPSHKIHEDDRYYAFLDINPVSPGHTLVIPKTEIDYLFDLDDQTLGGLLPYSRKIASAIKESVPCKRVGVMVAGLEVPHAHVHLIPIQATGDLTFARSKPADQADLASLAKKIISNLKS